MSIHPIEAQSYRILADRVDLSGWAPGPAAVAARIIHATADPGLLDNLVVPPEAVDAGLAALAGGAAVLCDVEMVRAGITGGQARCALSEVGPADSAGRVGAHPSRTAAAMARLAERHPEGAVVVVGCAPTALVEVVDLIERGALRPALVIGVPVGYVGASESKEALLELSVRRGLPSIVLRGERGGAAVAVAALNALVRLARSAPPAGAAGMASTAAVSAMALTASGAGGLPGAAQTAPTPPGGRDESTEGCFFIGHGTRSDAGALELRRFAEVAAHARPAVPTTAGFIEFMSPDLDEAIDDLVGRGVHRVIAVPLVLLGAGHMKDDGPAALARARRRHPDVTFAYARELGVHPDVLAVVTDRIVAATIGLPGAQADAVIVVGRGSTDPDANADLAKAARLLADGRGVGTGLADRNGTIDAVGEHTKSPADAAGAVTNPGEHGSPVHTPSLGLVMPAFVSLAAPGVTAALDHASALGARRVVVLPYFLFDGLLIDRIRQQVDDWVATHPGHVAVTGAQMGIDPRLVALAWHRFDEAAGGPVHMNCDGCLYRAPLPGYEHRVGLR